MPNPQAAGTGSETSCAWPTHATGDLGLLFVQVQTETVSTPSGWTAIPGLPTAAANNTAVRLFGFYRFATSSGESAATIPGVAVNNAWGAIVTVRNAHQTAPFHRVAVAFHTNANTTAWFPGLNTAVDDCLIVNAMAYHLDSAGPLSSAEANSSLANVAELYDAGTITGGGGGIIVITGEKATAGTVDATTNTLSVASGFICATIAIAPIADFDIAGTVEIDGSPAANGESVRAIDLTQPAASYLCSTGTTSGGTGAFTITAPYGDHDYQAVYEDGDAYGASAVDQAV